MTLVSHVKIDSLLLNMAMDLQDKSAIVTGAGSGISSCISISLQQAKRSEVSVSPSLACY